MFTCVFVGGTFDRLHSGHKLLLTRAFGVGEKVIIGLTSQAYVDKYKHAEQRPFNDRHDDLVKYLEKNGFAERTRIIPIDDPYEPAASDATVQAIVATSHNRIRAEEINAMRAKRGLTPIAIIEAPIITAEDGMPISSTRVREGEIDEYGHLVMPEMMRTTLKQPLGILHTGEDIGRAVSATNGRITVTVGDVTTKSFLDRGVQPALAVIDLAVRRRPYLPYEQFGFSADSRVVSVASGPGYISADARAAILSWAAASEKADAKKTVLVVKGEEDLLTLPVILAVPVGSVVFYGQPPASEAASDVSEKEKLDSSEGFVEVEVTDEVKKRVSAILSRFT